MDQSRRNFLKALVASAGGLVFGKMSALASAPVGKHGQIKDFQIVQAGDSLVFYNRQGHKLLVLDQSGTLEVVDYTTG